MGDLRDRSGLLGHPRGLSTLFFTELWERFSYYGMRAILMLYMVAPRGRGGLGFDTAKAAGIYGLYTGSVYFTAIPGGWIADRLLGLRGAVLAGGILIALGHYCLFGAACCPLFYAGLVLIVLGTGLLKANVSSIVGQLYAPGDPRRDAGFSIFYMGINIGAFVSPLVCGWLAQKVGWHWGFGAAAFGMTLGLVQYVLGLPATGAGGLARGAAEGRGRAVGPRGAGLGRRVGLFLLGRVALPRLRDPGRDRRPLRLAPQDRAAGRGRDEAHRRHHRALRLRHPLLDRLRAGRAAASPSSPTRTRATSLLGYDFPSSWYQSVEPVFVVLFAPVFAWLWICLGQREPSSPAKFAWGLLLVAPGLRLVALAAPSLRRKRSEGEPAGG